MDANLASFYLYNGTILPFEDLAFNHAMTVNTIYFWENPLSMLEEVYRILKNGGVFGIAFAQKSFMKQLPFVEFGFQLYNTTDVKKLVSGTVFHLSDIINKTEQVTSKSGEKVNREYTVIILAK